MTTHINLNPKLDSYCVVGNPVTHSKSPQIHQAFAKQTKQTIAYQAIQVELGNFSTALTQFQELGGKGLNITVPFKTDAKQAVDVCTEQAQKAGAVNTIWFSENKSYGDTTDGIGLIRDLVRNSIFLQDKRILLLGAGGAVSGVLASLLNESPAKLVLLNRTIARAQDLAKRFSEFKCLEVGDTTAISGSSFDIIINGTSASLDGLLPPLPEDIINQDTCCYDMVYADEETVFVHWARENGAKIALDGLGMLVEQAAESFYIWRQVRPETEPVIAMLRKGGN